MRESIQTVSNHEGNAATGAWETREALLEAAFQCAVRFGWGRVRMGDVAVRAGVSRQTLYRHFQSKDGLALALGLREQEAFLEGWRHAFKAHDELFNATRAAVTWSLKRAELHPLLRQAVENAESGLLPYITTKALPLIMRSRELVARLVTDLDSTLDPPTVELVADVITREMFSHVVTPSEPIDVVASRLATLAVRIVGGEKERNS